MKLDELGLDRIKTFGQPYHGLWKAGSIALPNSTSKTCPAPAGGGVVLLRVPGQPAVSRTAPELAADATAGREWRNYGLISGGRYGASEPIYGPPGTAAVIFIDAAKVTWLMHITWATTNAYMTVKLRRFGHFAAPWAETAWSSPINVTTYPYFNLILSIGSPKLLTVCQNTTGRQFVLGAVGLGGMYDYSNALLKIDVSGTVDLSVAGFGLTFSGTLLGGAVIESGTEVEHSEASGDVAVIVTKIYKEYFGETPTGIFVTRTTTTTNGGTPVIVDSPKPAINGGGYTYGIDADPTTSFSGARLSDYSRVRHNEYPVWAAYEEDTLKLLVVRFHDVDARSESAVQIGYFDSFGYPPKYQVTGSAVKSIDVEWEFDGVVVASKSASITDATSTLSTYIPSIGSADTTIGFQLYVSTMLDLLNTLQYSETPQVFDAPVVAPLTVSGVSWSSQCLACISRIGYMGSYTWTTHKVIAPSGASQTTSIPISSLFASWQPVTDQLAVDSVPICWF